MLRRDGPIARLARDEDAPRTARREAPMIDEQNVREMLHRRANAVPTPVEDPPHATRRARRLLLVNGAGAMLAVARIGLAGLAAFDDIGTAPVPAAPTPS